MSRAQIRILPPALVHQIAAGEVVGRPSSVVKELVENAMDAGATRIEVDIGAGGLSAIRVHDNGSGMSEDDVVLCVHPHATSKIQTFDDLDALGTFGFRGEALASIAAVSRLSLKSRTPHDPGGTAVVMEGSQTQSVQSVGCAVGTTVEVRDLFFNVPARLKFLKSSATESAHIAATCLDAALANPRTRFILKKDGKAWRDYLPASDFSDRTLAALGDDSLRSFSGSLNGVHIQAMLSAPERARTSALGLHLFVNQRPVRDRSLAYTVAHAYGSVLPQGRYPTGAVFLTLSPNEVDVNVHPQKSEVRFVHQRDVLETVRQLLSRRLGQSNLSAGREPVWANHQPPSASSVSFASSNTYAEVAYASKEPLKLAALEGHYAPSSSAVSDLHGFMSLRFLAQVRGLLLVCEGPDALYVLDQHAVDERIRFYHLHESYHSHSIKTQRLLFPERLECSPEDVEYATSHETELTRLGLECTVLGGETLVVHTIPALAQRTPPRRLLRDALDELRCQGQRSFGDTIDTVLATMACHAAIRAGDHLSREECEALLVSLDNVQAFNLHCPHGRPVVDKILFADIEHRLGR
ncbi:MAG: DNA mismatch repair endonuclease MutL [Myxococcales bacterium]|nr:DNA mismatch repair endonuclease MutL [Myxococcales bacterium]MCB9709204.1 DNA mismatch repair endonuclease MutL [Myxococcales bacterium]